MFRNHARTVEDVESADLAAILFTVLGSVIIALALLIVAGFAFTSFSAGPGSQPDGGDIARVFIAAFLIFLMGAGLVSVGRVYRQRVADLKAQALHAAIERGENDNDVELVLYLRPFDSTGVIKKTVRSGSGEHSSSTTYELEEQLAKAAKRVAPLVGLGQSLEHIGAAGRIVTSEDSWQDAVDKLMRKARLILIVPVSNPGTLWEIEKIFTDGHVGKTVFINVPRSWFRLFSGPFDQKEHWPAVDEVFRRFGYQLPHFESGGRMFFYGAQTTPVFSRKLKFESVGNLRRSMELALAARTG